MTLETVPWRGSRVPLLDVQRSMSLDQMAQMIAAAQGYMGPPPLPSTTYGMRPAEPISASFEGFAWGMLYQDGPVAAVEAYRLRVFGQAPLLYQHVEAGRPGDFYDDESLDRLRSPWPGATLSDLAKRALVYADLAGNAFVADLDDELVLLRPDWVEIVLEKRMHRGAQVGWRQVGIMYYEGGLNTGEGAAFLPGEYAHFVPGLPDPLASYRGMSWLTPLVREVKADKAASDHKVAWFENAASVNVAVSLPKEITAEQFRKFVEEMDSRHAGSHNAGRTLYTGGGADVTVIGANMQQADFGSIVGKGENRIANAGGIPAVLLGFSEGLGGSSLNAGNYTAAKRNAVDTTFRDLWGNWAASLQQMDLFQPPRSSSRLWYDGRDIPFLHEDAKDLSAIQSERATTVNTYVTAGFEPDTAVKAVAHDDITLLVHTGLTSVQLMPPGQNGEPAVPPPDPTTPDSGGGAGDPNAAVQDQARAIVALADVISRAREDEAARAFHPDQMRGPDGRWIKGAGNTIRKVQSAVRKAFGSTNVETSVDWRGVHFLITAKDRQIPFTVTPVDIAGLALLAVPGADAVEAARFALFINRLRTAVKAAKVVETGVQAVAGTGVARAIGADETGEDDEDDLAVLHRSLADLAAELDGLEHADAREHLQSLGLTEGEADELLAESDLTRALNLDDDEETCDVLDAINDVIARAQHDVSGELRIRGGTGGGRWTAHLTGALEKWLRGEIGDNEVFFDASGKPISRKAIVDAAEAHGVHVPPRMPLPALKSALLARVREQAQGPRPTLTPEAERVARIDAARPLAHLARDIDSASTLSEPERSQVIAEHIDGAAQAGELTPDQAGKLRGLLHGDGPEVRQVEVDNRIRAAYAAVLARRGQAARPGDTQWVGLADLRAELGDMPRGEVDAGLRRLEQTDGVNVVPESNQKTLSAADRAAAVVIGDQPKHAISIDDPSPRPLPVSPTGASKVKAAVTRMNKANGVTLIGNADKTTTFDPALHKPLVHDTAADSIAPGTRVRVVQQGHALDGTTVEKAVVAPVGRAPRKAGPPAKAARTSAAAPGSVEHAADVLATLDAALRKVPEGRRKSDLGTRSPADVAKLYRERVLSGELRPEQLDGLLQRMVFQYSDAGGSVDPVATKRLEQAGVPYVGQDPRLATAIRQAIADLKGGDGASAPVGQPAKKAAPAKAAPRSLITTTGNGEAAFSVESMKASLNAVNSKEEGRALLGSLTAAQVRELADALDIPPERGSRSKDSYVNGIVKHYVGGRLLVDIIHQAQTAPSRREVMALGLAEPGAPVGRPAKKAAPAKPTVQTDKGGRVTREEAGRLMHGDKGYEQKVAKKATPITFDPETVTDALAAATSREGGHAALEGLSAAELKQVAQRLSVNPHQPKAQLRHDLVEATVGTRTDAAGIRGGRWATPAAPSLTPRKGASAVRPAEGEAALSSVPVDLSATGAADLPAEVRDALAAYHSHGAVNINDYLRGTGVFTGPMAEHYRPQTEAWIRGLDHVMGTSATGQDIQVWRGLLRPEEVLGDVNSLPKNLTGTTFVDPAFVSTSVTRAASDRFVGADRFQLRIRVPKGTRAVKISGPEHESEILLDRGLTYRVVGDHTEPWPHGDGRVRILDVEAVDQKTPPPPGSAAPSLTLGTAEPPPSPGRHGWGDSPPSTLDGAFGEAVDNQAADPAYMPPPRSDHTGYPHPDTEVRTAIEDAWARVANGAGLASLADVRDQLGPRYPWDQVNRVLRDMTTGPEPDGVLLPETNQQYLTQRQRDARINLGGQSKHVLAFDDAPAARIRARQAGPAVRSSALDDLPEDPSLDEIRSMADDEGIERAAGHETLDDSDLDDLLDSLDEDGFVEVQRALGHDTHPGGEKLRRYWTESPEGLAKWSESPRPWTTLVSHLVKFMNPEMAKRVAADWFHRVFHFWPGSDENRVTHGQPPRGHRVGPG